MKRVTIFQNKNNFGRVVSFDIFAVSLKSGLQKTAGFS